MYPEWDKRRLAGLLDLVDIATFVIDLWDEKPEGIPSVTFDALFALSLMHKTAEDIMNYSKMNDCHYLSEKATFKDILKTLSLPGVRRVPMMGPRQGLFSPMSKRHLARFLTQTDILRFVATHLDCFGPALDHPVLGSVGTYPAPCVHESVKTIEAFREMISKKVTGIGVLDDDGKLIGELNIRDIGYIVTVTPYVELNSTIKEFLEQLRKTEDDSKTITCGTNDSVHSAITKINDNRSHRIYVLDSNNKPIGVISLSDICQFLHQLPTKKFGYKEKSKQHQGEKKTPVEKQEVNRCKVEEVEKEG